MYFSGILNVFYIELSILDDVFQLAVLFFYYFFFGFCFIFGQMGEKLFQGKTY